MMAIFALVTVGVKAQDMNPSNNGNTPYSRYGYGRMAESTVVRNRAMGGIGIGLRSNQQTNTMNPASYTAIDSLTFLFDFGMNAQLAKFKEAGASQKEWNGGLDYLELQFPMGKHFAASFGLQPYSYVGYSYGKTDTIFAQVSTSQIDTVAYQQAYTGNGGLNKVYLGVGFQPAKWISVGVNAGYIYGDISNNFAVSFDDASTTTYSYQTMSARALDLEFGIQLTHTFARKHTVNLGAIFAPKMNMWVDANDIKTTTSTVTDTINTTLAVPQKWGVGFTYVYDNRLTIGADYKVEKWSDIKGFDSYMQVKENLYHDVTKASFGLEYIPSLMSRNYFQRVRYRAGVNYHESYIKVGDSRNKEYGFTFGLGMPLRNQKSMVNFALEYVKVKPTDKALLSENYLTLNVGLLFNEFWFFKNKLK
jgi:hypothetical protein